MWAKKVDSNQKQIVETFRELGCSVQDLSKVGGGVPDLLVGYAGKNLLVEVKGPKGKLNDMQQRWHAKWQGGKHVVRSEEEALTLVQRIREAGW